MSELPAPQSLRFMSERISGAYQGYQAIPGMKLWLPLFGINFVGLHAGDIVACHIGQVDLLYVLYKYTYREKKKKQKGKNKERKENR